MTALTDGAFLWYLNRATGLVSLLLMTATVVLGVAVQRQVRLPGLPRFGVVGLHRNVSLVSAVLLVVQQRAPCMAAAVRWRAWRCYLRSSRWKPRCRPRCRSPLTRRWRSQHRQLRCGRH